MKCYLRLQHALLRKSHRLARVVQSFMVRHLQELGEEQAAHWFRTYWCGERGTWTIGDAGVGHCAHNNGVEGHWPGFTSAVCGSGGKSKSLKVDIMVGNTIKYVHDVSKETAEKQKSSALIGSCATQR